MGASAYRARSNLPLVRPPPPGIILAGRQPSGVPPRLHPVDGEALAYVKQLLERNDLPSDVQSSPARFYIARGGDGRVGAGGLELCGDAALLRSVVVERSARGEGVGTALCDALEARAAEAGVERLYLLTTTAAGFFADRGYERVERSDVPESVRGTAEFAELCPDTATVMTKPL